MDEMIQHKPALLLMSLECDVKWHVASVVRTSSCHRPLLPSPYFELAHKPGSLAKASRDSSVLFHIELTPIISKSLTALFKWFFFVGGTLP